MAVDQFMLIEEVGGESKDKSHAGEIDILSWSWGMSQGGSFHTGGGGGAGKVNVQDMSFTKYVDCASPKLMLYCSNGEPINEAILTVRKAGKDPLEYLKVKMTKVMVTSISTGGSGGEDKLTENVTLNFAQCEMAYEQQKDDGSGDTPIEYKWDIEQNCQL